MSAAHRILSRLFGPAEEINGSGRCPTYLYRWRILGGSTGNPQVAKRSKTGWAVYIHHFVGDDWSLDLHDHPKRFISIGLRGAYLETYQDMRDPAPFDSPSQRWHRAPWIRTFPATHRHRIQTPSQGCWTLVIVLREVRAWGFWNQETWYPWREYVVGKAGGIADSRKSCAD